MVLKEESPGTRSRCCSAGSAQLGAMLLVDGDYGKGTEAAVADARETLSMPGPADVADDELRGRGGRDAGSASSADSRRRHVHRAAGGQRRLAVSDAVSEAVLARQQEWHHDRHQYDCSFVGADQAPRGLGRGAQA